MDRRSKRVIGAILALIAAALVWQPLRQSVAVDRCLDSGGSFDYERKVCDHEVNHPAGTGR